METVDCNFCGTKIGSKNDLIIALERFENVKPMYSKCYANLKRDHGRKSFFTFVISGDNQWKLWLFYLISFLGSGVLFFGGALVFIGMLIYGFPALLLVVMAIAAVFGAYLFFSTLRIFNRIRRDWDEYESQLPE